MKTFPWIFLWSLVSSSAVAARSESTAHSALSTLYTKGVECSDRHIDSVLYFSNLIKITAAEGPFKNYYYEALNYIFYFKTNQTEETRRSAFATLKWANETGDPGLISDANGNLGLCYKDRNNLDSSSYYFKQALNKAIEANDLERFHQITINYSNILIRLGQKDEAMEYVANSILYDSLHNHNKNQGHNYHLLGNIHLYSGDYPAALSAYLKSLAAYERENNLSKRINLMNNIGLVYTSIGSYDQAKENYLELIELIDAHDLEREKISALINLGTVYLNEGNYAEDRKLLLEALAISEKYNLIKFQAQIQNNLGNVAYYEGNYTLALEYFQDGLATNLITQNKQEETLCHSNIGWAFLMLNREKDCFDSFHKALTLATEIKSDEKRMMALEGLADASEYFGNYEDALKYKNRFIALKDSIIGEKTQNKIAELKALYETEKKNNQIEDLEQKQAYNSLIISENELKISQLNWQRTGLVLSILVLALVGIFGWTFFRARQQREKDKAIILEREKGIQAVFEATEEERRRISRELHDGIGQQMSGLKLAWQNLTISAQNLTESEKNKLKDLSKILDSTSSELREISHRMMPKVLESFGLIPALEEMLEKTLKHTSLKYQFEHYNLDERLSTRTELALYRIAQELINNVIKHANANFVSVQLFKNQNQVILMIEDNGKGFEKNDSSDGHGLLNIKSRLNTVNGQINLEPSENGGTAATVRVMIA